MASVLRVVLCVKFSHEMARTIRGKISHVNKCEKFSHVMLKSQLFPIDQLLSR